MTQLSLSDIINTIKYDCNLIECKSYLCLAFPLASVPLCCVADCPDSGFMFPVSTYENNYQQASHHHTAIPTIPYAVLQIESMALLQTYNTSLVL